MHPTPETTQLEAGPALAARHRDGLVICFEVGPLVAPTSRAAIDSDSAVYCARDMSNEDTTMATDDRTPPEIKPQGDKLGDKVADLPEQSGKGNDEQVKGGRMKQKID
jgi:hypothetical protein